MPPRLSSILRRLSLSSVSGAGSSSAMWLRRQSKDPYVQGARELDYRARSAFKLIQIDDRHKILKPGMNCLDAGCAPGSWAQVLVERVNALGTIEGKPIGSVIGFDKVRSNLISKASILIEALTMAGLPGATLLADADIKKAKTMIRVKEVLQDDPLHLLVSDMAPESTGNGGLDKERMAMLLHHLLDFGLPLLSHGGTLITKILDGADIEGVRARVKLVFPSVRVVKPAASRGDSSEAYLLARHYSKPSR